MSSRDPRDLAPATRLVGGGRPARAPGASVSPELVLTSTYVADGDVNYAHVSNPTWSAFEETLAGLESDEPDARALAFASGMGAISAALSLLPHGGHVVVPEHFYNGTSGLLDVCDVPAVVRATRAVGALVVEDNTFNTPLGRRPLADGVDVVVRSVTKYLAGHSDVVLGALVTNDPALAERLHTQRTLGGAIPGPQEAWLALRGMRTLHLRWERACANAAVLAARLAEHPRITRVRYPGGGAMIAVEVDGGAEAAQAVERAVSVWLPATSLGGVESMLERRRRHALEPVTVPENLLRLSVGVEDVEDLWFDLREALDSLGTP